jgi:hypothetical protein
MTSITQGVAHPAQVRPRPNLRPIALPTEHGGWGFLLEPILLGMLVAPSWAGLLLGLAALSAFLTRQPLRFALQDLVRRRSYPRTTWCWIFVAIYATLAASFFAGSIAMAGWHLFIPLGLVAPLAITQVFYDARNRSRSLFPELCGSVALSSVAAAVAIAGGMRIVPALMLSAVVVARTIPSIVYVRTLLQRAHGLAASSWPSLVAHAAAACLVATFAPLLATSAMLLLLARAIHGLSHEPPRAQTLGWREMSFGVMTVGLTAAGYLL